MEPYDWTYYALFFILEFINSLHSFMRIHHGFGFCLLTEEKTESIPHPCLCPIPSAKVTVSFYTC